ncbi:pilus assembly protein TadG-related protein [Hyphomicrobium sp. LHD-15]|uniref:pilus assembly protein TadG-related protein n=1 Tax=Hyphomicrobium sp. LHD-15 TaxID=3072142 RepID=UPI0028107AD0|nr:pilus assembly protein TadG-related protein [Hyphomicrobium sp. LHD-15]MDQ8698985.1 TadG family pilus assembly protein [Hyphomicrobium sp. LHD-15]
MKFAQALSVFRDRSGAIGIVMALFFSVCVGLSALAVDVGSLYLERRTVQGVADLAALAAASELARADAAARATLAVNGFGDIRSLAVIKGRYEMDRSVAHGLRFTGGKQPYNAVQLDVGLQGKLYFAKSFMRAPDISVSAIGTTDAQAMFSIGSRLVSVRGGLTNAILGALLGGSVNLSVMDYRALLDANVTLLSFLSALATEVGVSAGTYSEVIAANATVGNVLSALVRAGQATGQQQAAQVLTTLLSQANLSATVSLSGLVNLGPLAHAEVGQPHSGLGSEVNVMSLVSAVASLANGDNQVAVNLGAAVPGLLSLKMDLAIGEPSQHSTWVTVGQAGATVQTAQTRLRLLAEVGGTGLLSGVRVRLPIYVEVGQAEARLAALTCQGGQSGEAVIEAKPAVVRAWVGDVAPGGLSSFRTGVPVSAGKIVDTPLLSVKAAAYVEMGNGSSRELRFTQSDVAGRVVKTAEVHDYLSSLTTSLLQNAELRVDILGLGIGLGSVSAIKSLVLALLAPVTSLLDGLLAPLLETVGVHLGEVDVQVNGMRCGSAVLAG